MRTSASNRRLRVILTALTDKTLDPRPDFQRRLVWSNKDKVNFIRTVLDGFPFPEIYIAAGSVDPDTGRGIELLVDGQQRMTTLHQYFLGSEDLRLGSVAPLYKSLPDTEKLKFLEYEVVVRDLGNIPVDEIKEIFRKINSTSYGLNAMEVHNARYGGAFKEFCEELSQSHFFSKHRIFSASEVRRMQDVRFCLVLAGTILGGYFNRDKEAESFLERYNEDFPMAPSLRNLITEGMSFVQNLKLPNDSRLFKKADLFTFLVEYARLTQSERIRLNPDLVAEDLKGFYVKVDSGPDSTEYVGDAAAYHKASLQGTNDRSSRIERGRIIRNLLRSREPIDAQENGSYIAFLKTLEPAELESEIDQRISISVQELIDTDAVISEMTNTNTTSWEVENYTVEGIEVDDDEVNVTLTFTVSGEQEDDKAWCGTEANGHAHMIINKDGGIRFNDVTAARDFGGDGEDFELVTETEDEIAENED